MYNPRKSLRLIVVLVASGKNVSLLGLLVWFLSRARNYIHAVNAVEAQHGLLHLIALTSLSV